MIVGGKSVLITGANRGIGKALLDEALLRGAARVYAGTRRPFEHPDPRVTPVALDVTDAAQIQAAVERVDSLDVLINNAGVVANDELSDPAVLDEMLAVNFFGVRDVTQAFLPKLTAAEGAIVTNVSLNALAPFPLVASYSLAKAAAFNLMQSLRAIVAPSGVSVHAVLSGPVDTDMSAGFDMEKASPESVASGILDGIANGDEEIFPDPMSKNLADGWRNSYYKGLERMTAELYAQVKHR